MPGPGIPSQDPDLPSRWFEFLKESDAIGMQPKDLIKPSLNSWLFPLEGSDIFSSELILNARNHNFSHSTYLISGEITFFIIEIQEETWRGDFAAVTNFANQFLWVIS